MLLAVLMPVYNERERAERAIRAFDGVRPPTGPDGAPMTRRLYVVDDGSRDGTERVLDEMASRPEVRVLRHGMNQGKGAAIRTALEAALADDADVYLVHDADLEYDPADHAALLAPIADGRADAVIGSRFLGLAHRVLYFWHYAANRAITLACNAATNLNLTDVECGSKAFTRAVARGLALTEDRFGFEIELIARLARMRLDESPDPPRRARIFEVPVSYAGRTYAEGKKITWRDGLRALWCVARYGVF